MSPPLPARAEELRWQLHRSQLRSQQLRHVRKELRRGIRVLRRQLLQLQRTHLLPLRVCEPRLRRRELRRLRNRLQAK
jgi:hypothetical protein